ncbi:MAG: hypothetical protein R3217_00385 [Gammaproteobacteria bacterium]|nr:hypothetical protein [Gammaproteobacteria bacterium]
MRPITVLNAILLGSFLALFLGTAVTLFIFALIGPEAPSIKGEFGPLSIYCGIFFVLTLACAASFLGHLKKRPWRWLAQAVELVGLAAAIWYFLP